MGYANVTLLRRHRTPTRHYKIQKGEPAILQKWVPYSQRYLVLGLVGLVGLAL